MEVDDPISVSHLTNYVREICFLRNAFDKELVLGVEVDVERLRTRCCERRYLEEFDVQIIQDPTLICAGMT